MPQNPPQLNAWPLIAPTELQPSPVPLQIAVGSGRNGAASFVVLQVVTPSGVATHILDPDTAAQIGRDLQSAATGIVIAPAVPPSSIVKG